MSRITLRISCAVVLLSASIARADDPVATRCWELAVSEPQKVAAYVEEALRRSGNDPGLSGHLRACRGWVLENVDGRINEAAAEYEAAVVLTERGGDQGALADALVLRGELRHYRGLFDEAIGDLQRSYAVSTTQKQRNYALNAIANLYADRRFGAYDRAIEYYGQLLAVHEGSGDLQGIATAHYNIGATLDTKGDLLGALASYQRALEMERKRRDAGSVADVQRALGVTLNKLGRYDEALTMLEPALAHFLAKKDDEGAAQVRLARGSVFRHQGHTAEAIRDLEASRAHFKTTESNRFLEKAEEERAAAYAALGNWRGAYEARGEQMALRDKMNERAREEHVSRLRIQFETQKKEQENRALLRIRRLQRIAIAVGVLVIAFLIYLAYRMRNLALTDELTKLPNRRHILSYAYEQLRAARADEKPFSMLAVDIDHFKEINDTYGHDAGDVVLRRIADTTRRALGRHGKIGRTGGEEFLVVLPETDAKAAAVVAERLRVAVEAIDCSDIAPPLRITVSIGVSESTSSDDFMAIAKRADDSLYRAKERGRNRVELAWA